MALSWTDANLTDHYIFEANICLQPGAPVQVSLKREDSTKGNGKPLLTQVLGDPDSPYSRLFTCS